MIDRGNGGGYDVRAQGYNGDRDAIGVSHCDECGVIARA